MAYGLKIVVTGALLGLAAAGGIFILSHSLPSQAVQAPRMTLDMFQPGNTYDDFTNTMTVGTLDRCVVTSPPGNNATHNHFTHLVIQDVEDLVAWQAQFSYDGGKMRPHQVNFVPFPDNAAGQNISFLNLPIDQTTLAHRDIMATTDIPPAAAGPQTARIGATYLESPTFAVSPDTPAKAVPDDASYSAPAGGVLASVVLQVLAGNAGQVLRVELEDSSPTPPGSKAVVFTGTGQLEIGLADAALFDGFHSEGVTGPTGDSDLDLFSDGIECRAGTDPSAPCPTGPTHDAWPPDINNNTFSDTADLAVLTGNFGKPVPTAPARANIAPDPPDGFVDTADIARMTGVFGDSCAP